MTQLELEQQLATIKNVLTNMLAEGEKKGKEISVAFEAGLYIGTAKAIIHHLEDILEKK